MSLTASMGVPGAFCTLFSPPPPRFSPRLHRPYGTHHSGGVGAVPPAIQRQHQGERRRRPWQGTFVIRSMGGRMQQGERELLALYGRYKRLALGTGAGLMLDALPTELV